MLRFAGVALLAVGLSYGRAAAAGDSVAAEALFREGRTAAQNGQWQAACAKFEESERLAPAPGTLLNLGDCKEHLGLLSSAWQHYQEALDRLPNDDDRRAFAEAKIAELSRQLSRLTIRLPPDAPRQTKVFRDGIELGRASLATALPVDPGTHVVEVDAPGHRVSRTEVTVAIGESKDLDAQLGSEVSPAVGADVRDATKGKGGAAPRPSEGSGRLTAGVVVLGVGIASLGVSVASGVLTLEKKNVVNDPSHCVNKTCDDEGVQAASAGKTFSAISTIAFAAAVVGIATGVVLIVSRPASRLRAARAWTQIGVGPGMGLQLRNAF